MKGYDLNLIQDIGRSVSIPLIANRGAGKLTDFGSAVVHVLMP
jgi:imidazole glycerol phosphate synthase subunit HisF